MRKYLYTIQKEDIGKSVIALNLCPCCGKGNHLYLGDVIGHVQPIDIGKQVYNVNGIIQIENEDQRDKRITQESVK